MSRKAGKLDYTVVSPLCCLGRRQMSRDVPPVAGFICHKSGALRTVNKGDALYYRPAVGLILFLRQNFILGNNQLEAQFLFCIRLFQFSTCFEQPCAHHQEIQSYQYDIWYMSFYVGDRIVCRFGRNCSSIQT